MIAMKKRSFECSQDDDLLPMSPSLSSTTTTSSLKSSVSWMQKSPNELIPMLKNAYSSLKDKERDLRLAAEIGKSLLENNMALKSNYDHLLLKHHPFPTPSSSTVIDQVTEEDEEEKELNYVPSRTREALVEMLEKKNADLSQQLETVLSKQEKLDRSHTRKARQLENQVQLLQASLDHATIKIQEMEENRKSRKTLTKDGLDTNLTVNSDSAQHQQEQEQQEQQQQTDCCTELQLKLDQLRRDNDHVHQAKAQIEKKLIDTLHDLRILKEQYDKLQFETQDHEHLRAAFDTQNQHITELKTSLEEHRTILVKLRERGVYIPSAEDEQLGRGSTTIYQSDLEAIDLFESEQVKKDNLLTELENAWSKHQSTPSVYTISSNGRSFTHDQGSTIPNALSKPFQTMYKQQPNVDSALESILMKAEAVERDALDDALSLIGRLENEYDHEKFLLEKRHLNYKTDYDSFESMYEDEEEQIDTDDDDDYSEQGELSCYFAPVENRLIQTAYKHNSGGVVGYAQRTVRSAVLMVWTWFRFMMVMSIAILISLKEGPNALS